MTFEEQLRKETRKALDLLSQAGSMRYDMDMDSYRCVTQGEILKLIISPYLEEIEELKKEIRGLEDALYWCQHPDD